MRRWRQRVTSHLLPGLILLAPALSADTAQEPNLRSFTAEYSLSRGYLELAQVEVELSVDADGAYRYSAHTQPVGLTAVLLKHEVSEISRGHVQSGRVTPRHYRYHHLGSESPRLVELNFDWERKQVTNSNAGSNWTMRIEPGTQDKFSQRLALMLAVSAGRRNVDFSVADGGRTKAYSFRFQGEESVEVAAGHFQALKLKRQKDQRPSRLTLWLSPALNYLPVMIKKREKDGIYWMKLRSVRWH